MDLDRVDPRFDRIVEADASLDQIAQGTYFGEGPVWDRRKKLFLWVISSATRSTSGRPGSENPFSFILRATPTA